jgi:hypothetical protein
MRVNRALEKLQAILKQRGAVLSTAALGSALAVEATTAAPAGLVGSITGIAIASSAGTGVAATAFKNMCSTKFKAGIIGALIILGVTLPAVLQQQARAALREQSLSLKRQAQQLADEKQRWLNDLAKANESRTLADDRLREVLRLRNEVGRLRQSEKSFQIASQGTSQPVGGLPRDEFYFVDGGGIAIPGRRHYEQGLTITAAIKACGGFTEAADMTTVRLVSGNADPLVVNIADIERGTADDVVLLPGG